MLHKEIVDKSTFELLKSLQSKPYLKGFHLTGGTALALRLGHRKSVDLDLFSNFSFNEMYILENLTNDYNYNLFYSSKNTLKGSIDNVKIDIIAHRYNLIGKQVDVDGISMLSMKDIAAMKLNAITVSGQRVKDFIDIFYLLKHFSLMEMISFYQKKYKQYNEYNVLKSLIYFNDIDFSDWPQMTTEIDWNIIKNKLEKEVFNFITGKQF